MYDSIMLGVYDHTRLMLDLFKSDLVLDRFAATDSFLDFMRRESRKGRRFLSRKEYKFLITIGRISLFALEDRGRRESRTFFQKTWGFKALKVLLEESHVLSNVIGWKWCATSVQKARGVNLGVTHRIQFIKPLITENFNS